MRTQEAILSAFNERTQTVEDDNVFIPRNTTHGHRKQWWTNYNAKLVDRISEIKAIKNN